jgi:hypothetical protein
MNRFSSLLISFLFILVVVFAAPACAQNKQLVGWIEKVRVYPGDLIIHAKLDTGAKSSSLGVSYFDKFKRNGKTWVSFELTDRNGKKAYFEKVVEKTARIKRHGRQYQRRPVIRLGICLGSVYKEVQVNLVDRSEFIYPMLIGRSFMEGLFVVDPSDKFTTKPQCKDIPGP